MPSADVRNRTDSSVSVTPPALACRGLRLAIGQRVLLDELDLELPSGRTVAVMGPSGSGKTTLLHCIAGLRPVHSGEVRVGDAAMSGASERRRAKIRLERIGMVFQFGELLPELTVAENVELPLRLRRRADGSGDDAVVTELLDALDLGHRRDAHPAELSGGELQRAAIARAVAGSPELLLADEPTGALDDEMSQVVCRLLIDTAQRAGAGLVVATHDPQVAAMMDETLRLRAGRLEAA